MYDANYHHVLGYLLRRTTTRQDAEDVLAETFLTAWRRCEDMPGGPATRPWLYGVARNALANHLRGERRRGRLSDRLRADVVPRAETAPDPDFERTATAFSRLSDKDRSLLALAAWEGLSPHEIATALGCSHNAARVRLHRARRRFERELADTEADETRWSPVSVGAEAER